MQSDVETPVSELQQSEAEIRQTAKQSRKAGAHKGFSLLTRKDSRLWLRIRNKYGTYSELFPKGTLKSEANDIAQRKLHELKNSTHGLPSKEFQRVTFARLAEAALNSSSVLIKLSVNDRTNVNAFLKNEKTLCATQLNKITWRDIQRHVNRRLEDRDVKPFTITRMLVPIVRIYANAAGTDLYGLIPNFAGHVPNPFNQKELQLPQDNSGRERFLNIDDDAKIYTAINQHCRTYLMKRRMIALVGLAIATGLRRGVLLQLRWKDIRFEDKVIDIPTSYYTKKKPAPDMVPISKRMDENLNNFYNALPEQERKPSCKLFPNRQERETMHGHSAKKTNNSTSRSTRWCDDAWHRAIRLTDLWVPFLDDTEQPIIGDDREPIKDWFHFHDLRHTAVTRYRNKPYKMDPTQYDYLLGKEKHRYAHLNLVEFCDEIRECIDNGDDVMEEQLTYKSIRKKTDWGFIFAGGKFRSDEAAIMDAITDLPDKEGE
jgi:integrase